MWEFILKLADKLPYRAIGEAIKRLVFRRKLITFISFILLSSTVALLAEYYKRSQDYSDIVNATLHAKLEPTAQQFKGLEAFMMSKVDRSAPQKFGDTPINAIFLQKYEEIETEIRNLDARTKVKTPKTIVRRSSKQDPSEDPSYIKLKPVGGNNNRRVFADIGKPGFQFIPLEIIHGGYSSDSLVEQDPVKLLSQADQLLVSDTVLKKDIVMSRTISEKLKDLLAIPLVDPSKSPEQLERLAAQVYLVTSNGANRIFSSRVEDGPKADAYYGTQFSSSTFFPSRPYFLGALDPALRQPLVRSESATAVAGADQKLIKNYFYVSQPYMDLAGNGIVVTASRVLPNYKNSIAVLCLDFTYVEPKNLSKTLLQTIGQFDAPKVQIEFDIGTETRYIIKTLVKDTNQSDLTGVQNDLIEHAKSFIQNPKLDLASFFGNIQEINRNTSSSGGDTPLQELENPIEVSIPIGNIGSDKTTRSGDFLLFALDLRKYRHITDIIGFSGCTCLAIFSILLVTAIVATVQRNDDLQTANVELKEAFARVGSVLSDAPTPYTLLDSNDLIKDCNRSFCEFIGKDRSSLLGQKFRDLIAENDHLRYDIVQGKRAANESVEPYMVGFSTVLGDENRWIVSAAVPSIAEGNLKGLPETFGILLTHKPQLAVIAIHLGSIRAKTTPL